MFTKEGVYVDVREIYPSVSRKRSKRETTMVSDAVKTMQSEINSKLQYLSTSTLQPMGDTITSMCKELQQQAGVLGAISGLSPDAYIRWLLDDPYLTATILDDIAIYWPCKPVDKWFARPNTTKCYTELPIRFHTGAEWTDGYMNTQTGDIALESLPVNCSQSVHWFKQGNHYYQFQGQKMTEVVVDQIRNMPMRINNTFVKIMFVPKWSNTWVYNATMFIQQDRVSAATQTGDIRYEEFQRYITRGDPDSQLRFIVDNVGLGAWGTYPYGLLYTIYRIAYQLGGILFFYKTLVSPLMKRVSEDVHEEIAPEVMSLEAQLDGASRPLDRLEKRLPNLRTERRKRTN